MYTHEVLNVQNPADEAAYGRGLALYALGYSGEELTDGDVAAGLVRAKEDKYPHYMHQFVADDGQLVGVVAWTKWDPYKAEELQGMVHGLVVASEFQGRGVGRELMRVVEVDMVANGRNMAWLQAGAAPNDKRGDWLPGWYESQGYVAFGSERIRRMGKMLTPAVV